MSDSGLGSLDSQQKLTGKQRPELAGWFGGHRANRIPRHAEEENAGLESILPAP